MIRHIPFICLSAVLVVFAGCGPPPPVTSGTLFLDNVTEYPVNISVDGNDMLTVAAGETGFVKVPLGEHVLTAKSEGESIHQQMFNFEYASRQTQPCFILNTNDTHRYCRVEIVYGNNRLSQGLASGMTSMMTNMAASTAVGDDPEAQKKWIEEKTRKFEFKRLLAEMYVFGGEPISRFRRSSNFLTPLPSMVAGSRYSSTERRSVVVRIPNELYNEIEELSQLEAPTQEDLDRAYRLKSEVIWFADELEG